jgi:hypothetical protein
MNIGGVHHELFDVGRLEMLAKCSDVSPRFENHEHMWIEAIPVNVELQRTRLCSGSL